ncbi:cytochrome P450 [Spirillospora albida]|uniref:cytochrome P450 n=1 Tax=Spirillospora albida TaxID=58123 RepID=UPI0004C0077C|nr:cytochrome P450 [Spirillospora albida]
MDPQTEAAPAHAPLESLDLQPLMTRDYDSRPALFYERLRAEHGPIAPVEILGVPAWLVLGYPQMLDVLRDTRGVWSRRPDAWRALREGRVPADWPLLPAFTFDASSFKDGAELTRLRTAWSEGVRPFQDRTRPQAKELEHAVQVYADELITALAEGGRTGTADLSVQYARPLPLMVLNRLLGVPAGGRSEELIMDVWRTMDATPDAAEAQIRLITEIGEVCAAKSAAPGQDLPSFMLAAVPDLALDELTREISMLTGFIADLTGALIGNTVIEVISGTGGARESLSAGMIQEAVNRAMISSPPMANMAFRWPRTDVRIGRYTVAAGDPVMLSPAAAHLDPAFTGGMSPDALYSSRAHLGWGAGAHACVGREFATTIATIAVERLFDRFCALRPALPPDQLPWRSSPITRGLRSLPVHYELAKEPAAPAAEEPVTPMQAEEDREAASLVRRILRIMRRAS